MTKFNEQELAEFDRLTREHSAQDPLTRVRGRLGLRTFIEMHGKEKCDAMWAHILESEKKQKVRK